MTPKRRWPNEADHARVDAIALAQRIKRQILPMLDALEAGKMITSLELSLRLNRISNDANDIEIKMKDVGPREFVD